MSALAARLPAQAKVNLALHVGARREDGYHELATLFARVELADDVQLRVEQNGFRLRVMRDGEPDESLGPPEKNLAVIAARAYATATHWPPGCEITIEKRIPVGAGLGGGSADAGAVLRTLNSLAPRPVHATQLLHIASALGADVPFMTIEAPLALGTRRGDDVQELPPLDARWVLLVLPTFSISTADAYAWLDATRARASNPTRVDPLSLRAAARDWDTVAAVATNDFESVIAARYPPIESYLNALRDAGARIATLSGSGSAVFGVFASEPDVAAVARACKAPVLLTRAPARVVAPLRSE